MVDAISEIILSKTIVTCLKNLIVLQTVCKYKMSKLRTKLSETQQGEQNLANAKKMSKQIQENFFSTLCDVASRNVSSVLMKSTLMFPFKRIKIRSKLRGSLIMDYSMEEFLCKSIEFADQKATNMTKKS